MRCDGWERRRHAVGKDDMVLVLLPIGISMCSECVAQYYADWKERQRLRIALWGIDYDEASYTSGLV